MILVQRITRMLLVDIAKASEFHDREEIKVFIKSLEARGLFTEATEDEIEEYDSIDDSFYGEGY